MASGGAEAFTTDFNLSSTQPTSTTQPKCLNHKKKEVEFYCNNCNIGLCSKCILEQHKEHERLDIECDETRNKAIEKLERSQNMILNRIKDLEKTRTSLLESFEEMKSLCEDSCAKVTEKTEQIFSDLRKGCKQIIKDIRNNLEENRKKVEDREMEITSEIDLLEGNTKSNISPSTKTTLNILQTLPRLLEIVKQDEKDYRLCLRYLQWVEKRNVSLDIDKVGSVISKTFYIPGSYQFIFDIGDVMKSRRSFWDYLNGIERRVYNSKSKFKSKNLVNGCVVSGCFGYDSSINIELLPENTPDLNNCLIDYQLSVLHIDDDSQTITKTYSDERIHSFREWSRTFPISLNELTDKSKGYLNSNNQFVIQFDIKRIIKIYLNRV